MHGQAAFDQGFEALETPRARCSGEPAMIKGAAIAAVVMFIAVGWLFRARDIVRQCQSENCQSRGKICRAREATTLPFNWIGLTVTLHLLLVAFPSLKSFH